MRLVIGCLLLAMPALAQLDSAALRAKFGEPLPRETFHVPPGFDLAVDYNAYNEVCQLEVPAEMPPAPDVTGPSNPTQEMQNFLANLAPESVRAEKLSGGQGKIIVRFKTAGCEPTPQPPEAAQLDSAVLRAKFGEPLHRETFRVRPEVEIAADYGASGQVCRIQVPPLAEYDREDVLAELVPDALRGQEIGRMMEQMGMAWVSIVEYERVTITEAGHGDTRDATNVRFKVEGCR